jgi:hypothetical protein
MRPAKIVAIIIGVLLIIVSLPLIVSGAFVLWFHGEADSDGYLSTSEQRLLSNGYAVVTPDVELHMGDWVPGRLSVQLRATSGSDAAVFLGIGPTEAVAEYLRWSAIRRGDRDRVVLL